MSNPDPVDSSESVRPLVLIVEDEMLVRMLISDILRDDGFKVIEANDTIEALQALEAHPGIHVLLTDAEMPPGRTGFDLAREVCERWPSIEILISSGRMRPGPDDIPGRAIFLPKPWSAETLSRHMQEAAERATGKDAHRAVRHSIPSDGRHPAL